MKAEFAPIVIPTNPFWKVLRTFGRDEFLAGVISIAVTALIEVIFWYWGVPPSGSAILLLALAGPIFEKIGLFAGHFRDAWRIYGETPPDIRKPLGFYVSAAFRGGAKSLIQDILVHDPIYTGLMLGGMHFHPSTPAFLLVPIAFGLAVIAVAALEVGIHELRYLRFQRGLFKLGFQRESYLESRLYLEPNFDPQHVIRALRDQFLPGSEIRTLNYYDHYCLGCVDLPEFNSRSGKLRVRNRVYQEKPEEWTNTVQIVYSRAVEASEGVSQFRCFPMRKDKFYKTARDRVYDNVGTISALTSPRENNKQWNAWIKANHCTGEDIHPTHRVSFVRYVAHNHELLVSVDHVQDFYLIELKAYPAHAHRLKEAMRYVMHHFPVMQMTHGKSELVNMLKFDEPGERLPAKVGE